ncbi:MAG: hypothetical protein MJ137_04955, partial [Clostridia bacterium]|nr:hypothetical protein [Clostridia bacterium]
EGEKVTDLKPTCTEYGHGYIPCKICGEHLADGVIPPTGHKFGADGKCEVCGDADPAYTGAGTDAESSSPTEPVTSALPVVSSEPPASSEAITALAPVTSGAGSDSSAAGNGTEAPVVSVSCTSAVFPGAALVSVLSVGAALIRKRH